MPPDTAMWDAGGGAGSLEVICRLSSVPIAPLSRRALSAWKLGSKRRLNASSNLAPDRAEAAARARAGSWSIGFSQKIALPAAAARTLRSEEHTSELQSLMRI